MGCADGCTYSHHGFHTAECNIGIRTRDIRRMDTPESRAYWASLEEAAAEVRTHKMCFSNLCVLQDEQCPKKLGTYRSPEQLRIAALEVALSAAVQSLKDYGQHKPDCYKVNPGGTYCTCGLLQAVESPHSEDAVDPHVHSTGKPSTRA